jgi:hypothetical protein
VDKRPRGNVPPKNPQHILELSDDSNGDSPLKVKKVPKNSSQKKLKVRPTVIESSDDSVRATAIPEAHQRSVTDALRNASRRS